MRISLLFLILVSIFIGQTKREYVLKDSERIIKAGSQTVRWGNENILILEGDLIIEKGAKLIIDPGTTIKFRPNMDKGGTGKDPNKCELIVRGELVAIGRPFQNQRITFTSAAPVGTEKSGDWYGIVIYKNSKLTRLQSCDINYGHRGISCFGSSPIIENSQILYSFNSGLYVTARSKAQIQSNVISSNSYAGIEVLMKSTPKITQNTITSNEYGIMIYDSSSPNLGSNEKDNENIGQNEISDNFTYDIYNHSTQEIKAANNNWGSTNVAEIQKTIFDKKSNALYGNVKFLPINAVAQAQFQIEAPKQTLAVVTPKKKTTTPRTTRRPTQARTTPTNSNKPVTTNKTPAKTVEQKPDETTRSETIANNTTTTNDPVEDKTETITPVETVAKTPTPAVVSEFTEQSKIKPFLNNFLDQGTGLEIVRGTPIYGGTAARQNIKGRVIVQITVGFDGNVERAQILKAAHTSLEQASLDAAYKFKFTRPTYQGQAVRFVKTIPFKF